MQYNTLQSAGCRLAALHSTYNKRDEGICLTEDNKNLVPGSPQCRVRSA